MDLETLVLVKPSIYKGLDKNSAEGYFAAEQRQLSAIKTKIIDEGIEQLKVQTGYTHDNLPDVNAKRTHLEYDDISFTMISNVKINNPPYQKAIDKISGFLEYVANDWKQGVRKDGVRSYHTDGQKEPFIRWDYLMYNLMWHTSAITELGVANSIEEINAPKEYDEMRLERLQLPIRSVVDFDITRPGHAKMWYLTKRFHDEVALDTVKPMESELERKSGVSRELMPKETVRYWEQIENYAFQVMSIPSPRRQPKKVLDLLFKVPQKAKRKGELPVIIDHNNYNQFLEDYRDTLPTSLKKWAKSKTGIEGKIGEIITFYYGIENHPLVQAAMPALDEYKLKRDGQNMFIRVQALYDRLVALEQDYRTNRLITKHSAMPLI